MMARCCTWWRSCEHAGKVHIASGNIVLYFFDLSVGMRQCFSCIVWRRQDVEALTGPDQQNCMLASVVHGQSSFSHQAQKVSIDQRPVTCSITDQGLSRVLSSPMLCWKPGQEAQTHGPSADNLHFYITLFALACKEFLSCSSVIEISRVRYTVSLGCTTT